MVISMIERRTPSMIGCATKRPALSKFSTTLVQTIQPNTLRLPVYERCNSFHSIGSANAFGRMCDMMAHCNKLRVRFISLFINIIVIGKQFPRLH